MQKFASVQKAMMDGRTVDLKQGLESEPDRTKLIENIKKTGQIIKKQEDKLQQKFLSFADPEHYPFAQNEANVVSELTFDPQTLGPGMTLSKDLKTLCFNSSAMRLADHHFVRCLQHLQTNSLRWFFQLSEHFDWTIGLCDTSTTNSYTEKEVYGLRKNNNNLSYFKNTYEENSSISKMSMTSHRVHTLQRHNRVRVGPEIQVPHEFPANSPWKIEATWDYTSQLLTFYSRNKPTKGFLLCQLKTNRNYRLCPFFERETNMRQNDRYVADGSSYTEILCVIKQ